MSQTNYFSYNIIDSIYYNQPTGNDLKTIYGIDFDFKRRNEYDQLNEEEQALYEENEKSFIEAVINKYIMDDFGNGSYIGIDTNYHNNNIDTKDITYAYFKSNKEVGIELSDMISNINGTHNYKLISAKDIDFDNVILPNSAIERDFNWSGFDRNRRWGNKPIHINNTFELLNVIDYLLCACDNLWNELYKIKYSVNEGIEIWFTKDASDKESIYSAKKLVVEDFQLNSTNRTDATKMITYLDPFNYYTSLNNNSDNNFGIVTNFYKSAVDSDNLAFDRKIIDNRGRNIILMVILPNSKQIPQHPDASLSQNVNGLLQQIYAYKIGNELKLYPGARIDAFINDANIKKNPNELIDFKNKKLKSETFFKSNSKYFQVYIKFLNQIKFVNFSNNIVENPYFLYYIDNENKKVIITYNYEGSNEFIVNDMKNYINISSLNSYKFYNESIDDGNNLNGNIYEPKFYVIPNEFCSTLEVATPNSSKFKASSQSIKIYYYKNTNKLNCKITRLDKNGEPIEILAENDPTQEKSLTYNYFRYNIPDGQEITFKFDATYIASDNSPEGNPLGLKLDDEYKDIMLYNLSNISDSEKTNYYQLIDTEESGTYKRNFMQFTTESFDIENYTNTDDESNIYKHIWVKYDNPYKLNVIVDNDELITQSLTYGEVQNEIQNINLTATSYNTYTLNHNLTEGIEEVKLNLRFKIDETSKVKSTECIIPLNINKIYNPTINYYSYQVMNIEREHYDNKYTYRVNNIEYQTTLGEIYEKSIGKYGFISINNQNVRNMPQDIYDMMVPNEDIDSLDVLQLPKTYDSTHNNAIFEFTYNNYKSNVVNLIGGWYTEQYIKTILRKDCAPTQLIVNGSNPIILKSDNSNLQAFSYHLYMFNLNGFGKNYRLHGNSNTLPSNYANDNATVLSNIIYPEFDLISVASNMDYQSINKQLKFKLLDNDVQLSYISVQTDEFNNYKWEQNNLDFNSGTYISHKDNNITYHDYIIKTLPIDIYKTSYIVNCHNNFEGNNINYSTYYIPITYMCINSTTFYPPISTIPNGPVPDINIEEEKIKYGQYMDCWNNDNYNPITLSMKLIDNTIESNPYYYESNEAIMQFNIKRTAAPTININGRDDSWIYVSIDSMYYLSDFIYMGIKEENQTSLSLNTYMPCGSYFYYDEQYSSYIVNEIYSNTYVKALGNSHNNHYKYVNLGDDNKLFNPDWENINIGGNNDDETGNKKYIVPYPIFKQMIQNENDEFDFSETLYNYDIYRLSDINKLNLQSNNNVTAHPVTWNSSLTHDEYDEQAKGIDTNTIYHTITFNNQFVNNFGDNNINNTTFNMIYYHLYYVGSKGSKNYQPGTTGSVGTNTWICPIIREYIGDTPYQGLYLTTDYQQKKYEFFTFKYNDIYVVRKKENSNDEYEYYSVAPNNQLTCQMAYDIQLKIFMHNKNAISIDNIGYLCDRNDLENFPQNKLTQINVRNN